MTEINPREHDEAEEALYFELAKAERQVRIELDRAHEAAGDNRDYRKRNRPWGMKYVEALAKTTPLARARHEQASEVVYRLQQQIAEMEAIYRQHGWQRFFPCGNRDGHIHSSLRGCSSVYATTVMYWRPGLSGKTIAEAVADLGEALCTFCFPGAPSDWKAKTLGQVKDERTAGERAAAKAAKEAAWLVKNLRKDEQFRNHMGDRVTTVAACKQALRDEVDLGNYGGRGPHPWHHQAVEAAEQATKVLLARGVTQDEIDKIIANAQIKLAREIKKYANA